MLIAIQEENTNKKLPLLNIKGDKIEIWDFDYDKGRHRDIDLTLNSDNFVIIETMIKNKIKKNTFYSCDKFCGSFGTVYGNKCIITDFEVLIYKNKELIFRRNRHDNFWLRGFITNNGTNAGNKYYTIISDNKIVNIRKYNRIKDDEYIEWRWRGYE